MDVMTGYGLCFLICKMGTIVLVPTKGCLEELNVLRVRIEFLGECLASRKPLLNVIS